MASEIARCRNTMVDPDARSEKLEDSEPDWKRLGQKTSKMKQDSSESIQEIK